MGLLELRRHQHHAVGLSTPHHPLKRPGPPDGPGLLHARTPRRTQRHAAPGAARPGSRPPHRRGVHRRRSGPHPLPRHHPADTDRSRARAAARSPRSHVAARHGHQRHDAVRRRRRAPPRRRRRTRPVAALQRGPGHPRAGRRHPGRPGRRSRHRRPHDRPRLTGQRGRAVPSEVHHHHTGPTLVQNTSSYDQRTTRGVIARTGDTHRTR
ncbi:hypothetical protein SFR_7030 (plasmid) [Streptomyces sp. FR-008]|nr:hypothetical protein SFR_7030 [Streptomyces sp. FR-008]